MSEMSTKATNAAAAPEAGNKPMTPDTLAKVITRLKDILVEENRMLAENRPKEFTQHLQEKTRLVAIYNQQMSLIKQSPDSFRNFPKPETDRLKEVSAEFYEVLDIHFRKLSTVKTITEGLVRSVADEVAKKKAPPRTYTAAAGISASLTSRNAGAANNAIAINQVI
ncbi:MAG: hypothetical protein EP348_04445 [Alphaproteobacteria bacterium]|nr:MAG: hypothetical protein EP348_04445 [Alphaproteobacteria bacterium]